MGNKLENIIRSIFKNELPQADNWNTPSSKVWEKIEHDLKEKKRFRPGFFWVSLGFVSFVIFGFLLIRQCSLMDRPSNRQLISSITFPAKDKNTVNSSNELETKKVDADNPIASEKTFQAPKRNRKQFDGPPTFIGPIQNSNFSQTNDAVAVSVQKRHEKEMAASYSTLSSINAGETVRSISYSKNNIDLLPTKPISPLRSADLFAELAGSPLHKGAGHILTPVKEKPPSWVIITDLTLGAIGVDVNFSNSQNEVVFDNRKTASYGVGIRVEHFPGNKMLGFGTGLQYSRVRLLSDYGMSLNYTSQNEHQNPDGHFDNVYHSNMPSLFGELSAELALLRLNSSVVDEGTPFDLSLTMEHQLDFLRVPLYTVIRASKGSFRFFARTGFSINYLISQPTSFVNTLESNHDAIHHRHSILNSSDDNDQGLHRWQLGVLLGAGLEYQITSSLSLGVEPYFSKNITPVYRNAEVSSATSLLGSNLSFRYNLK